MSPKSCWLNLHWLVDFPVFAGLIHSLTSIKPTCLVSSKWLNLSNSDEIRFSIRLMGNETIENHRFNHPLPTHHPPIVHLLCLVRVRSNATRSAWRPPVVTESFMGWFKGRSIAGWWFQPLWKILVSWDDYSQYMEKIIQTFQTTNQMIIGLILTFFPQTFWGGQSKISQGTWIFRILAGKHEVW